MKRIVRITLAGIVRAIRLRSGGGTTPPQQLTNTLRPSLVSNPYEGQEIAVDEGIWSTAPDSYSYRWLRDGEPIAFATRESYLLTADDVGTGRISVRVTANKAGYLSATATSNVINVAAAVRVVDLEELASGNDVPTITYAAQGGTAAPSIAGSAGWHREKRVGVTETPVGQAQNSTAPLDRAGSTRFRYPGFTEANNFAGGSSTGRYVSTPLKTGGGAQSAYQLFGVEFIAANTDTVELHMIATVTNPRLGVLLVNNRRVQARPLQATASGGSGFRVTLRFPTVGTRRIKLYGLNHNQGRWGGAAVGPGGSISKPTNPITRRVVVIGDSQTNGAGDVTGLDTYVWDVFRAMKADEVVQLGIGGTGFTVDGGDASGRFINRVGQALAADPDVLVIAGGGNDGNPGGLSAAVAEILDATDTVPERYIFSTNRSDAGNTTMRNAAQAAGVAFLDIHDYIQQGVPLQDAVHPTYDGHRQLARLAIQRLNLVTVPDPDTLEPATGTPSTGLAWELPTAAQIAAGPTPTRVMLTHYYAPQPGAFANAATDSFESAYLAVNGEGGIHAAYGGFCRDRPGQTVRAPYPTTPVSWQRSMQNREIQAMKQAGLDGAFCNIMGSSGANWDRYLWLLQEAAANFPGFKVVPMIDANGNMAQNETTAVAAARVNTFLSSSAAWVLPDGRYVVGTFKMEGRPLSYWTGVRDILASTHGKQVAFIGVYNSIGSSTGYDSIQWAVGRWGPGADPSVLNTLTNDKPGLSTRGKLYLAPVWGQDIRYRSGLFDEAANTACIRAAGDLLIRYQADMSQLCTWSDHSENSHLRPSVGHGHAFLDINTYRLTRWKTGKPPRILRDVAYLSHRNQMLNATVTGGQTLMLSHWSRANRSSLRDEVEVLTYLTAPATVTVKVASAVHTYTAPAGEHAHTVPASPGEVSVKVVRASTEIARIHSPVVIRSTVVNQDRQYFAFSSLRGTSGQYDPTPGAPTPNSANYLP